LAAIGTGLFVLFAERNTPSYGIRQRLPSSLVGSATTLLIVPRKSIMGQLTDGLSNSLAVIAGKPGGSTGRFGGRNNVD